MLKWLRYNVTFDPGREPRHVGAMANMPMPIDLLLDHPAIRTASNGAYHIILTLLLQFWRSECRPLPTHASALIAIARTDAGTWRMHQQAVLTSLAVMCPEIGRYYGKRVEAFKSVVERSRRNGAKGGAVIRARWKATAHPDGPIPTPEPPLEAVGAPIRASRGYDSGKGDKAAREASRARHAGVARGGERKRLSDGDSVAPDEPPVGAFGEWTWQPSPPPTQPASPELRPPPTV